MTERELLGKWLDAFPDLSGWESATGARMPRLDNQTRALLATPAAQPEPVAWLYHDGDDVRSLNPLVHSTLLTLERQPHMRNETPLYAAPAAAPRDAE